MKYTLLFFGLISLEALTLNKKFENIKKNAIRRAITRAAGSIYEECLKHHYYAKKFDPSTVKLCEESVTTFLNTFEPEDNPSLVFRQDKN